MLTRLEDLLAPGDAKAASVDWSRFRLDVITGPDQPEFERAYEALWREFGPLHEIETPEVLAGRLEWDPQVPVEGLHLQYRLALLTQDGRFAAVRDHTAIMAAGRPGCVVHLSHLLVAPEFRRTGIAGALRAFPLRTARECLVAAGRSEEEAVTLAAEMEHADPHHPARMQRLAAYEKAGYRKPDPRRVPYLQPDFREPAVIDAEGGPHPLPFSLILRRVGREAERTLLGSELREIAERLYRMYALGFRASDMAPVFANLDRFPAPGEAIALLSPTAA